MPGPRGGVVYSDENKCIEGRLVHAKIQIAVAQLGVNLQKFRFARCSRSQIDPSLEMHAPREVFLWWWIVLQDRSVFSRYVPLINARTVFLQEELIFQFLLLICSMKYFLNCCILIVTALLHCF